MGIILVNMANLEPLLPLIAEACTSPNVTIILRFFRVGLICKFRNVAGNN